MCHVITDSRYAVVFDPSDHEDRNLPCLVKLSFPSDQFRHSVTSSGLHLSGLSGHSSCELSAGCCEVIKHGAVVQVTSLIVGLFK